MAAPKNQSALQVERDSTLVKNGILPAVDYWITAVERLVDSPGAKAPKMEASSKAQQELERIEKQISELESAAGENQQARRQLHDLHDRVGALLGHADKIIYNKPSLHIGDLSDHRPSQAP